MNEDDLEYLDDLAKHFTVEHNIKQAMIRVYKFVDAKDMDEFERMFNDMPDKEKEQMLLSLLVYFRLTNQRPKGVENDV